jgi:hypothetical protein
LGTTDVAGVAEDDRSAERPDAVDVGERRAGRGNRGGDAIDDGVELLVEPAHIAEQVCGDALAFEVDELERADAAQDLRGASRGEPTGERLPGSVRTTRRGAWHTAWGRTPVRS